MEKNKDVIIAVICKREKEYIREFVEYHLKLGFDKIYVGDNNDDVDEHYDGILADLIKDNKVAILNYRHAPSQQIQFYNYIIDNIDYEWCAFIDCDEFLTFNNNSGFSNIKSFLNQNRQIDNYHVNWMCFGDCGNIVNNGEGGVLERFPNPLPFNKTHEYDFPENYHIKSILRKNTNVHFVNPHSVFTDNAYNPKGEKVHNGCFSAPYDYSILFIRHYMTKTLDEWCRNKMTRNGGDSIKVNYTLNKFFARNEVTKEKLIYLKNNGYI